MNYSINYHDVLTRERIELNTDDVNKVVGFPKVISEVKNNRLIKTVVFEETPIEKMNDGLVVDDFALEVLLENGYEKRRIDYSGDSFENLDRAVKGAEELAKTGVKIVNKEIVFPNA